MSITIVNLKKLTLLMQSEIEMNNDYIVTCIEIQRIQRGLMACLFHNEHLHKNGKNCIACKNSKIYLAQLKAKREVLRKEIKNEY